MADAQTNEFLQGVATSLDTLAAGSRQSARMPDAQRPPIIQPWDAAGLFLAKVLDLSTLAANVQLGLDGYEIAYVAPASDAGGVLILNDAIALFPGQRVRAYFQNLRVRRGLAADGALLTSVTTGVAYLVVHKVPTLEYRDQLTPVADPVSAAAIAAAITASLPAANASANVTALQTAARPVPLYSDVATVGSAIGLWFGPNGTYTSFALADCFDFTPYRSVEVTLVYTALTGGTAPTVALGAVEMDALTAGSAVGSMFQATTATQPAGGGAISMVLGQPGTAVLLGGGYNHNPDLFPKRSKYAKLAVIGGGGVAPTGMTGGRLIVTGFPSVAGSPD